MNLVQRIEAYLKDRRIPADVGTWEKLVQVMKMVTDGKVPMPLILFLYQEEP